MKILIVSRAVSYKSENAYDIPKIFNPARESLFELKKDKRWTVDIIFLNHRGIYNPESKNLRFDWIYESMPAFMYGCTRMAKTMGYDYIMVVEPDIVLPKNALFELMNTIKLCDIAIGIYPERPSKVTSFSRGGQPPNGWLVCMPWNKNPKAKIGIEMRTTFPIDGCAGFGCVLMNVIKISHCSFPQRDIHGNGPDFGFYESARLNGLKILGNSNVRCGHIENNGAIIRGR